MKQTKNNIPGNFLKLSTSFLLTIFFFLHGFPQEEKISPSIDKQSFIYAVKDTNQLGLDVYTLKGMDTNSKKPCVIFVFGGAFVGGRRDDTLFNRYFNSLTENNYVVVPISYRMGLRGAKNLSKFNITPLRHAIDMAVDDVYDATNWIIAHANQFGIDTSKIILSGSSSGAITVLESDFKRRNENIASNKLVPGFEYAGVMAFSGAILSFDWRLKYRTVPAPTLMFHGTADKIVPYKKIKFLNKGFYGSSWIAKTFKEKGYPYYFYSEVALGHEVSVLPMIYNIPVILDFLDKYIVQKKPYQTYLSFKDPDAKPMLTLTAQELFKKLQNK
jgi:predicted esterase